MALTVVTEQPISTAQLGLWSVVSAASANAAVSDGSDTSYVQIAVRARTDVQVLRLGFAAPTIPAGAQIYSVGLRRRVRTVTSGSPQPVCNHWFRCVTGNVFVAGQQTLPSKQYFTSPCPTTVTSAWVTESIATYTKAPDGTAWSSGTNLTGFSYDMGRGDDFGGNLQVSEVYLDITYQQLSSVTVTGPTGTVTTTRPTITWTYSSPDSQPQQSFRVAIYTAAQVAAIGFSPFVTAPIQQSGWTTGEALAWTLTSDLADGGYSAYVQATSKWAGPGTFTTAISSITWARAVTPATPPPSATLQSATFDATNNRVVLSMVPSSSSPVTAAYTIQASRDSGLTWTGAGQDPIPSLTYIPANGMSPVVVYDYVANVGVTSQYRVQAYSSSSGVFVGSVAFSNVLSVMTSGDTHWLKNPQNPLQNTPLPVSAPKSGSTDGSVKVTKRRMTGTFQPVGGAGNTVYPIVVQGPQYGDETSIELIFVDGDDSMTYWAAVDQLDRSGAVLLWQKPDGTQQWVTVGSGASGQEVEETYDALAGVPSVVRWRRRKLTLTQVDPPAYF